MKREVHATTEYRVADQKLMEGAPQYFLWQARLAKAELGRRVLEVGCGAGNFSRHLQDRELVVGVDCDPNCIRIWNSRFADLPGYVGCLQDAESPDFADLKRYGFDSIVCLNVLEHIADDELLLRRMAEICPVGGRVVLMVPAFESLYGEIDARLGHYRRYTRRSLGRVATSAGFTVRTLRYMNPLGFFGWWANAKILTRTEQSAAQIEAFDRLVPVLSTLESCIRPPFGQSLLAVLERA